MLYEDRFPGIAEFVRLSVYPTIRFNGRHRVVIDMVQSPRISE